MITDPLKRELLDAATATGYAAATDFLLSHARPCIYVVEGHEVEGGPAVTSRLSGDPDLSPDTPWPPSLDDADRPAGSADFLAQVSFAEVPRLPGLPLPEAGLLSVFVRRLGGLSAVALYDARPLETLSRRPAPADIVEDPRLIEDPTPIAFRAGVDLPFERAGFEEELFDRCEGSKPWNLEAALAPDGVVGQIGGYAFADRGRDMASLAPRPLPDPTTPGVVPDWLLLLRLHLYDVIQIMAYIRKDHLAAKDFTRVWFTGIP